MSTLRFWKVRWVTVVDRPERRDASYPKVKPGTRVPVERTFTNQTSAVKTAERLIGGDEDFGSEYPDEIRVTQVYEGRSPRRVRKTVCRERQGEKIVQIECGRGVGRLCKKRGR